MYWQGTGGYYSSSGKGAPYRRQERGSIVPIYIYILYHKGKKILVPYIYIYTVPQGKENIGNVEGALF